MNKNISVYQQTFQEDTENQISSLAEKLPAIMRIQGDTDGKRKEMITSGHYRIRTIDVTTSTVQGTIDDIKRILLPAIPAFKAIEAEAAANKRLDTLKANLSSKEIQLVDKQSHYKLLPGDAYKRRQHKVLYIFMLTAAGIDSIIAYSSFLSGGYSYFISGLYSMLAAALIASAHFVVTPLIKKALSNKERNVRTLLAILMGALFFIVMGNARTEALSEIDISVGGVSQDFTMKRFIMPMIGFLVFVVILLFSLQVYCSKWERKNQFEREKLAKQIRGISREISLLKEEIEAIPHEVTKQKQQARELFYYYKTAVKRCENIAIQAVFAYRQAFVSSRISVEVPDFMLETPKFLFDTSIQINEVKTEVV